MNLYSYVRDSNLQIDILGWEDIVFRCLRPEDIESIKKGLGIIPKNPSANASPIDHVLYGANVGYGDQFISFTRNEKFANRWAIKSNSAVVSIDLDTIQNEIIDISTAEGRIAHLGNAGTAPPGSKIITANKFAKGADEVLVEGKIPNNKIIKGEGISKLNCRGVNKLKEKVKQMILMLFASTYFRRVL